MSAQDLQRASDETDWPRPSLAWWAIAMLALAYCISILDRVALSFLIVPIEADLHITDTQMGLLQGAGFAIFFAILGFPMGVLADRMNRKVLLVLGMVVWSLATIGCGLAAGFAALLLARVVVGAGEATLTPAGTSMIGDYFSPDRRSRAFSVYSLGSSIGAGCAFLFIGSILHALTRWTQSGAGSISNLHPWQWMFILLGAPGVVSAGLFLLTVKEPPRRELLSKDAPDQAPLASFFQHMQRHSGAYTALFGVGVATGISTYGVIGWFPTFVVRAYGVSAATTAGVMGFIGLPCGLISSLGGGWVIGEFYRRGRLDGPIVISAASLIILMIGVAVATLSTAFAMTMCGYAIMALMTNVPIVAILTGVNRITPNRMRAQSMAVFSIFTSLISQVAGPLAIGGMAEHVFKGNRGVGYGILTAICVACTLSVLAIVVLRGQFNRAERMMQR